MSERVASQQRALVVDDEPLVRQVTMRALSRVGFVCDAAANGKDALEMVRQTCYALVVTDLRMPEANGHLLAVEILSRAQRPAVIVLTGVLEPKLTKDLTARGVEEVFHKPVNYQQFAARAKQLTDAHCAKRAVEPNLQVSAANANPPHQEFELVAESDVPRSLKRRLTELTKQLPSPETNFDGFRRISGNTIGIEEVTLALQHDRALLTHVLRLVNNSIFSFDQRIRGLEESSGTSKLRQKKIIIFVAGMFAGWLLSSFCLAVWLLQS